MSPSESGALGHQLGLSSTLRAAAAATTAGSGGGRIHSDPGSPMAAVDDSDLVSQSTGSGGAPVAGWTRAGQGRSWVPAGGGGSVSDASQATPSTTTGRPAGWTVTGRCPPVTGRAATGGQRQAGRCPPVVASQHGPGRMKSYGPLPCPPPGGACIEASAA